MGEIALRIDNNSDHAGGIGSTFDIQFFNDLRHEIEKLKSNRNMNF